MACVYEFQGKTYDQEDFIKILLNMKPSEASKYMPGVSAVPNAPFVGNTNKWSMLAVKRMVRYAAENGYDSIAWTPGEVQAERYDLSKQVDTIRWKQEREGRGILTAIDKNANDHHWNIAQDKIEDYVGKEVAQKIIDKNPQYNDVIELSGLDLKVGGEGMKGFYDKILPAEVNKFFGKAKWGKAKVKLTTGLPEPQSVRELAKNFFGSKEASRSPLDIMDAPMIPALKNNKILEVVVGSLPVDMVDNLVSNDINPKDFVSKPSLFSDSLPIKSRGSVFEGLRDTLSKVGTRIGTGLRSASKAGLDKELFSTLKASDLSLDEALRIAFPVDFLEVSDDFGSTGLTKAGLRTESSPFELGDKGIPTKFTDFIDWHNSIITHPRRNATDIFKKWELKITPEMKSKALYEGMPQFALSDKKFLLKAVAVRTKDGTIFKGKPGELHVDVLEKIPISKKEGLSYEDSGFIDYDGKFYNRAEASILYGEFEAKMAQAKGLMPQFATTAIGGKDVVEFKESLEPVTQEDYVANRTADKSIKMKAVSALKRYTGDIRQEVSKLIAPISTRLARINKSLMAKIRKLDFDTNRAIQKDVQTVLPLLQKSKAMTRDDSADWDYARKNSDIRKINDLVEKYDMRKEHDAVRGVYDDLRKEAIDVGLDIGEIEEYWNRRVRDLQGLLGAMGKEQGDIYTRKLWEKAEDLGVSVSELDNDMRANIITNMILGGPVGPGGVTAEKQRVFRKIPVALNKYYAHSDAALIEHIGEMRTAIEKRKFFGKIPQKVSEMRRQLFVAQNKIRKLNAQLGDDPTGDIRKRRNKWIGREKELRAYLNKYAMQRDYTDNIGAYIDEMMLAGEIRPGQQQEVNDLLKARFHDRGTHGFWQAYKNLSYIDTMGSPISALTQIGDLAWSMYDSGFIPALKHAARALPPKRWKKIKVTREDVGAARIAQEFADPGTLGKAVTWVFKHVGLEKIDAIGKEALLNSSLERYQKEARSDPEKLANNIRHIFERETEDVIQDLLDDEITDNVKLLVYNRLVDFQPVGLSEVPERYLTSGNGRIFYMLKTFTIKQFDVLRNEAFHKMRTGDRAEKIQGLKNFIRLSFFFILANATADELKDWMLGRETDFDDRVADNILRLAGSSKFITWKARTEGVGSAMARQVLPPFKFIDSLTKDIYNAGDDKDLELTASIPLIGKLAYWHLGRGVHKRGDLWDRRLRKHKARLKRIKERYDRSKDKAAFLKEHRADIVAYRRASKFQGKLNKYRKIINKLKSREETPSILKRIEQLENRRTELIKKYLGE